MVRVFAELHSGATPALPPPPPSQASTLKPREREREIYIYIYRGHIEDDGKENGNYYLGCRVQGTMINRPSPFKGLIIRIPIIIPINGGGL